MLKNIIDWFKNRKKKIEHRCPICGSTDLGYCCTCNNYGEVVYLDKAPTYSYSFVCQNCGHISQNFKSGKEMNKYLDKVSK